MIIDNEKGRIWKEVAVTLFNVICWNFPGQIEVNHENLSAQPVLGRDLNP
jgi:hypothetical protein